MCVQVYCWHLFELQCQLYFIWCRTYFHTAEIHVMSSFKVNAKDMTHYSRKSSAYHMQFKWFCNNVALFSFWRIWTFILINLIMVLQYPFTWPKKCYTHIHWRNHKKSMQHQPYLYTPRTSLRLLTINHRLFKSGCKIMIRPTWNFEHIELLFGTMV